MSEEKKCTNRHYDKWALIYVDAVLETGISIDWLWEFTNDEDNGVVQIEPNVYAMTPYEIERLRRVVNKRIDELLYERD